MRALPSELKPLLPEQYKTFQTFTRSWLSQLYFDDPRLHYEFAYVGQRGFEIGLHFESKNKPLNQQLLAANIYYMVDLKVTLGEDWVAEDWDKGWTKVYTLIPKIKFSEALLTSAATQLAAAICHLEPLRRDVLRTL